AGAAIELDPVALTAPQQHGQSSSFEPSDQINHGELGCPVRFGELRISRELELLPLPCILAQKEWCDELSDFVGSAPMGRTWSVAGESIIAPNSDQHRIPFDNGSFAAPERQPKRLFERIGH